MNKTFYSLLMALFLSGLAVADTDPLLYATCTGDGALFKGVTLNLGNVGKGVFSFEAGGDPGGLLGYVFGDISFSGSSQNIVRYHLKSTTSIDRYSIDGAGHTILLPTAQSTVNGELSLDLSQNTGKFTVMDSGSTEDEISLACTFTIVAQ